MDTYLGPPENWGFWMLAGSEREKRRALRERLEAYKLRPTWQRMKIGMWVFEPPTKHFTPEDLYRVMQAPRTAANSNGNGAEVAAVSGSRLRTPSERDGDRAISLATIYNTLNAFADAELVRVITDKHGKRYYDTNTTEHHHLHDEGGLGLIDIPQNMINWEFMHDLPEGYEVDEVLVTLRIKQA